MAAGLRIAALAALPLTITACEPAPQPEPLEPPMPQTSAEGEASGEPFGTYDVTLADGGKRRQLLYLDGRYEDFGPDGAVVEQGTWRAEGMSFCFQPAPQESEEACYTAGDPAPDGTFEKFDADGNLYARLRRIEPTDEAPAEPR